MDTTPTVSPPGEEEAAGPESEPERPGGSDDADAADAVPGASLSKDELFHLLQNSRRRAVLRYLRGRERPVRMRDVAEQVAAWEHDTTVAGLGSDERQRVYVALYQSHLDTLADAGAIKYDKSRGTIEPRPLLDRVAAYADPPVPTGGAGGSDGPAGSRDAEGSGDAESAGITERTQRTDADGHVGERERNRSERDRRGREGVGRNDGVDGGEGDDDAIEGNWGDVDSGDGGDGGDRSDGRGIVGDPWSRRYLGASVLGSVLLAGAALDLAALRALSGVAAGALVLLAFSGLTAARLVVEGDD